MSDEQSTRQAWDAGWDHAAPVAAEPPVCGADFAEARPDATCELPAGHDRVTSPLGYLYDHAAPSRSTWWNTPGAPAEPEPRPDPMARVRAAGDALADIANALRHFTLPDDGPDEDPTALDGATTRPPEFATLTTAAEFAAAWNALSDDERQATVENIAANAADAEACFVARHRPAEQMTEREHLLHVYDQARTRRDAHNAEHDWAWRRIADAADRALQPWAYQGAVAPWPGNGCASRDCGQCRGCKQRDRRPQR